MRWLTGPVGRELVALAGSMDAAPPHGRARSGTAPAPGPAPRDAAASLDDSDRRLLQLLTEGRTNAEIAAELDLD